MADISARWYSDPDQVPTWNYIVLEMEGPVRRIDRAELLALLEDVSAHHEARVADGTPWTMDKMARIKRDRMMDMIAGFELTVQAWRPTFKLSQNKPPEERARLIEGLKAEGAQCPCRVDGADCAMTLPEPIKRLAIFDCDGTLVDSQADICAAMDAAFTVAGLAPPDRNATRRIVGLSLPEAMRRLCPEGSEKDHAALAQNYRDAFRVRRAAGQVAEPLYDGIAALIEDLAGAAGCWA